MFTTEFLKRNVCIARQSGQRVGFGWADVLWGYQHQFFGWRTPVEMACNCLKGGAHDPLEFDLAGVGKDEDFMVGDILEKLAAQNPVLQDSSKRKWLYLSLLRLYEDRGDTGKVMNGLDEIYADFDYPEGIASFVPFQETWWDNLDPTGMLPNEAPYDRIMRKWREFLESERQALSSV